MSAFNDFIRRVSSKAVSSFGTALHLPEFGVSEAIKDPNRAYFQTPQLNDIKNSFQVVPGAPVPSEDPNNPGGGGGGRGSGGTVDALAPLRSQATALIQNLNNLYNSIYGDVNNYATDQRNRVDQGYQQNLQDAQGAYTKGIDTAGLAYAGRGLGDSSYLGNQKQDLTNTYQADVNNQNQAHDAALAGISQNVQSALGQYQANQAKLGGINPNDYGTAADLQSLISQLTGQQDQLNQARPGFLTQSGLVDKLNSIAPAKQQTSDQISKALQQLTTSSAPQFAKDQLAQGIIQRANLQDQGAQAFWQDYYQKLLTGQVPSLPA